ncbi:MAG: nucleoside deaminase [Synergistaceae bacterium]|nr:nucleoside deaminase [Synergistaceae bacterium]
MSKTRKILEAMKNKLLPLTEKMVEEGNHVFGGLVLRADDCSVVAAGSNNRLENPIYHGEIDTIQRFFALKERPAPEECIFVASHAPCPMCISAISWAGFREIWALFGYEEVKDGFDMPVDMMMYREIFSSDGPTRQNRFFKMYDIRAEAEKEPDVQELKKLLEEIDERYAKMKVKEFEYPGI